MGGKEKENLLELVVGRWNDGAGGKSCCTDVDARILVRMIYENISKEIQLWLTS